MKNTNEYELINTTYPFYWIKKAHKSIGSIFYIHGFADNPELFLANFKPVDQYDIYAIELPGHSQTPIKSVNDLNPLSFGQYCVDLIKALNIKNLIIIGHSMGGGIAMYVAAKLPHIVKKMILIAPANSHCVSLKNFWHLSFGCIPKNKKQLMNFFKKTIYGDKQIDNFINQYGDQALNNFTTHKENYKILHKNMATQKNLQNMKNNERHVQCQTLLLLGKQDKMIDYKNTSHYLSQQIAHITIEIFDKTRHSIFFEQPILFNQVINDFLKLKECK